MAFPLLPPPFTRQHAVDDSHQRPRRRLLCRGATRGDTTTTAIRCAGQALQPRRQNIGQSTSIACRHHNSTWVGETDQVSQGEKDKKKIKKTPTPSHPVTHQAMHDGSWAPIIWASESSAGSSTFC